MSLALLTMLCGVITLAILSLLALAFWTNPARGLIQTTHRLEQLPLVLKPGGRVAVITFHSLEDRLVKLFLRDGTFSREADPIYGHSSASPFELMSKKPIEASAEEVKMNDRSRSARLRVAAIKEGAK